MLLLSLQQLNPVTSIRWIRLNRNRCLNWEFRWIQVNWMTMKFRPAAASNCNGQPPWILNWNEIVSKFVTVSTLIGRVLQMKTALIEPISFWTDQQIQRRAKFNEWHRLEDDQLLMDSMEMQTGFKIEAKVFDGNQQKNEIQPCYWPEGACSFWRRWWKRRTSASVYRRRGCSASANPEDTSEPKWARNSNCHPAASWSSNLPFRSNGHH